jgi:D-amino-acid dehydrogenase
MAESKRVVIVGAGIAGLSAAYYTAQKGHQVTVLEREGPDFKGCSFGNAGMIVPSHFVPLAAPGMVSMGLRMMRDPESPFWLRPRLSRELASWSWKFMRSANAAHVERAAPILRDLHLASRAAYEGLAALPGVDLGLVQKGLLMLCETDSAMRQEARLAEMAQRLGLPGSALSPSEVAEMEPGIRMNVAGAVYYPQDCHMVPDKVMASLSRLVTESGASVQWSTPVSGFRTSGGRVTAAVTRTNDYEADEFVIAGGSWSPEIVRPLRIRLPMQAGKGYSLTLARPRQLPAICGILVEGRVAVTPMGESLRFAGTMEIAGTDLSQNPRRVTGIVKTVCRAFPDFTPDDFRGVEPWCGLRPCSPDGVPYIGRFRKYKNLLAATGHAMMGLSLGPVTGKIVAAILSGEDSGHPLPALSPDRFG